MAKLFANLDRLKNAPRPNIVSVPRPIVQGEATLANTKYAKLISLEDRLKQSKLGTTKHLPEFFLSDLFTGIVKIQKLEPYQHTSNIKVTYPSANVAQGSATIKFINYIPTQGGTNPTYVTLNSLNLQGTIFSNGVYYSVTTITYPVGINAINHGSVVINNPITIVNQGPGTNPTYPIGLDPIKIKQGLSWNGLIYFSSVVPNTPLANYITIPSIVINTPAASYITVPTLILGKPNANYLTFPTLVIPTFNNLDPDKKNKTQGLQTLRYTADRSLAYFAPQVKHGSEEPQNQDSNSNTKNSFNVGNAIIGLLTEQYGAGATAPVEDLLTDTKDNKNPESTVKQITSVLGDREVSIDRLNNLLKSKVNVPVKAAAMSVGPDGMPTGITYTTYSNIKTYNDLIAAVNKAERDPSKAKYKGKEVKITLTRYGGGSISFTAFLTSLSDSVAASYGDINYLGKQDTFKVYKGTTRQIGVGFKAVALGTGNNDFKQSANGAKDLAAKVNKLIQLAVVGKASGKAYTEGPFVKFSLTGLYSNLAAVVGSVKVDVSTTETPWDYQSTLPMYYDITLDLTILSTQEGTLFDSNKTFIG